MLLWGTNLSVQAHVNAYALEKKSLEYIEHLCKVHEVLWGSVLQTMLFKNIA